MLNPKKDRLNYGEILRPPAEGYTLTKAIATTYSLDLDSLMIMPVALLYSEEFDRPNNAVRIDVVHSLVHSSEKIIVYHQQGKIKVPLKYHFLMAFWEKSTHAIRMPYENQSFHPKVWVIRFDCEKKKCKYRVIVTSRNLTFANDYDVAFETEGTSTDKVNKSNRPLIDFLLYLNKQKETMDTGFISDLQKINFDCPENFTNLTFNPVGIGEPYNNPIYGRNWQELLIISPFLDKSSLKLLSNRADNIKILSTQDDLSCVKDVVDIENCWQFSKQIEQSSFHEEIIEIDEYHQPQSIHAKLYIGKNLNAHYWYLGSANCTAPAHSRNIEFMIGMTSDLDVLSSNNIQKMLTDINSGHAIFEKFIPCNTDSILAHKNLELEARKILYYLLGMSVDASIILSPENGLYDYVLNFNLEPLKLPDGFKITIRPVSKTEEQEVALNCGTHHLVTNFTAYTETKLTPFFAVSIYHETEKLSFSTWQIPIDLPATRLNKIFTTMINNKDRFMDYLLFILNGENSETIFDGDERDVNSKNNLSGTAIFFDGKPIFENLLLATSRDKSKLEIIQQIIKRIQEEQTGENDEQIITEDFLDFWSVFETFIEQPIKNVR